MLELEPSIPLLPCTHTSPCFSYHVANVTMSLHCHDVTPIVYRGGVLEPEGTVEIKYRQRDIVNTMARLDSVYAMLLAKSRQSGLTKDERDLVDRQLKAREDLLSRFTVRWQFSLQILMTHQAGCWRKESSL